MDKDILNLICCPKCNGDLVLKVDKLICKSCKKEYIIKDNIPILIDEDF